MIVTNTIIYEKDLKKLCKKSGVTFTELAKAIGLAHITVKFYSNEYRNCPWSRWLQIKNYLDKKLKEKHNT